MFFTCADVPANNVVITPEGGLEWAKVLGEPRGFRLHRGSLLVNQIIEENKLRYYFLCERNTWNITLQRSRPNTDCLGKSTPMLTATKQATSFSFKRKVAYNNEPNTPPLVVDASGTNKWLLPS